MARSALGLGGMSHGRKDANSGGDAGLGKRCREGPPTFDSTAVGYSGGDGVGARSRFVSGVKDSGNATYRDQRPTRAPPISAFRKMQLATQTAELKLLHAMRVGDVMPLRDWIADMQISLTELCDPVERGEHLGFTVAEDERFATEPMGRRPINRKNGVKVTAARFPSWIAPAGETAEERKVRRDKFTRARRKMEATVRLQTQRAAASPEPVVGGQITGTVDHSGRLEALLAALPVPPAATTTIARVAKRLRRHPAWRGPLGQLLDLYYLGKAIGRLVRAHPDLIGSHLIELGGLQTSQIWRLKPLPFQVRSATVQHRQHAE
jgi:hypothetical protein